MKYYKKVQVGIDHENAQSEKKIPTPKTEVGNKPPTNLPRTLTCNHCS